MLRDPRSILILTLLGALLCVPSLGARDLWNPDEPRYAEVAKEMRLLGDYLIPHLNEEVYSQKPPLFFWMAAALQWLGAGMNAGRIVVGGLALGTLVLTFLLGRLWFSPRVGLLAAGILATTELFARIGRAGVLDVPLTFCVIAAAYGWARRGAGLFLFYAAIGTGVLIKGPVAILWALLTVLAVAVWPPQPRPTAAPRSHLWWGPMLTLAIIAAWLVPACVRGGPDYAQAILVKQSVGRAVDSWSHRRPWWYYGPYLCIGFLPWIALVPGGVVAAVRNRRRTPASFTLAVLLSAALLVFSAISGKRERYLLPAYPLLALLVAQYVEYAAGLRSRTGWARRSLAVVNAGLAVFGVGLAAFGLAGERAVSYFAGADTGVAAAFADVSSGWSRLVLLTTGGAMAMVGLAGRRIARSFPARAAGYGIVAASLMFLCYDVALTPRINRLKSPRAVAAVLRSRTEHGEEVAAYPVHYSGAYHVYSSRTRIEVLREPGEVVAFLSAPLPRAVLVAEGELRNLPHAVARHFVFAGRVGHRRMGFLTNTGPPR